LKNFGNTPAIAVASRFELQLGETLDDPPDTSIFNPIELTDERQLIPPGEPIIREVRRENAVIFSEEEIIAILHSETFVWLCGQVRYIDVYGRGPHQTNICEVYRFPPLTPVEMFSPAGFHGYNRAT